MGFQFKREGHLYRFDRGENSLSRQTPDMESSFRFSIESLYIAGPVSVPECCHPSFSASPLLSGRWARGCMTPGHREGQTAQCLQEPAQGPHSNQQR